MSSSHSLDDLFEIERETHIAVLIEESRFMHDNKFSPQSIKRMFRAAHSLKGAARLVEKLEFEKQAHELEELLKKIEDSQNIQPEVLIKIDEIIKLLSGKHSLQVIPTVSSIDSGFLHITNSHISELMQLASELAVLTRRIDNSLTETLSSHQNISLIQDGQRAATMAGLLQRLTYRLRLTALHEVTRGLPSIAKQIASELNKKILLRVYNANTLIDRDLLRKIEPCLIQLLKNSIDHAFEAPDQRIKSGKSEEGRVIITAKQCGASVEIEFKDDGKGIDVEEIRKKVIAMGLHDVSTSQKLTKEELIEFLFLPGFTTRDNITSLSGRGVGLDIVKATLIELGGDVSVRTEQKVGTTFSLRIPSRIASFRALVFESLNSNIAVPLCFVDRIVGVGEIKIQEVCGQLVASLDGEDIPLCSGETCFKLSTKPNLNLNRPIIILKAVGKSLAILVDRLDGEKEVVVNPLDHRYQHIDLVLGIAGGVGDKIVTIINPEQLLASAVECLRTNSSTTEVEVLRSSSNKILVVDDSLTVRELERRLLIQAGYECDMAIDGADGLEKILLKDYDLVITDIDMPRLNGFDLIKQIRSQDRFSNLPLLVVSYKERTEDRDLALTLGANSYLSKGSFKDDSFIKAVVQLLEEVVK